MKGPDPLTGERPGGRSALPGMGTEMAIGAGPDSGTAIGAETELGTRPGGRARPGKNAKRAGRPARLSLSNWPVSARLVAVFVAASVTGLIFGGLRVADAAGTANGYARTTQLAVLGKQITLLVQDLENERDRTVAVAALTGLQQDAAAAKA